MLPFKLGSELGDLAGQRLVLVGLGLLPASDLGASLTGSFLPFLVRQCVTDAGQGRQIDLCREVILLGCQRLALICHRLRQGAHIGLGLVGLGGELLQGLAGSLLAIGDHLAQAGELGGLIAAGCLELANLLSQCLIPLRLGALGFQERSVERPVILFQGGLQLGHPLGHGLIGGAQGAIAFLQGGSGLAVCRLVIGLELA
ncbi:hypothetical protein D3C73_415170 [compost metagenome]